MYFDRIKGFYYSSVSQTLIIAMATLLLFFWLGDGIFGGTTQQNGSSSSSGAIVEFNSFVLIYVLTGLVFGSLIFYLIFTKLKDYGIRIVYTIILGLSYLLLIWEVLSLMFDSEMDLLGILGYSALTIAISVFGAYFLLIYIRGEPDLFTRNAGIIISAVIIGRLMALYFDLISIIIFSLILGIFDIYSVFKGPLAKIMGKPQRRQENMQDPTHEQLRHQFRIISNRGTPVIMSYHNTILGIGDVLFFSILMYQSLVEWYLIGMLVTTFAISLGSIGTLLLLQRVSPLPGLPIPVSLSLIGYVILSVIY